MVLRSHWLCYLLGALSLALSVASEAATFAGAYSYSYPSYLRVTGAGIDLAHPLDGANLSQYMDQTVSVPYSFHNTAGVSLKAKIKNASAVWSHTGLAMTHLRGGLANTTTSTATAGATVTGNVSLGFRIYWRSAAQYGGADAGSSWSFGADGTPMLMTGTVTLTIPIEILDAGTLAVIDTFEATVVATLSGSMQQTTSGTNPAPATVTPDSTTTLELNPDGPPADSVDTYWRVQWDTRGAPAGAFATLVTSTDGVVDSFEVGENTPAGFLSTHLRGNSENRGAFPVLLGDEVGIDFGGLDTRGLTGSVCELIVVKRGALDSDELDDVVFTGNTVPVTQTDIDNGSLLLDAYILIDGVNPDWEPPVGDPNPGAELAGETVETEVQTYEIDSTGIGRTVTIRQRTTTLPDGTVQRTTTNSSGATTTAVGASSSDVKDAIEAARAGTGSGTDLDAPSEELAGEGLVSKEEAEQAIEDADVNDVEGKMGVAQASLEGIFGEAPGEYTVNSPSSSGTPGFWEITVPGTNQTIDLDPLQGIGATICLWVFNLLVILITGRFTYWVLKELYEFWRGIYSTQQASALNLTIMGNSVGAALVPIVLAAVIALLATIFSQISGLYSLAGEELFDDPFSLAGAPDVIREGMRLFQAAVPVQHLLITLANALAFLVGRNWVFSVFGGVLKLLIKN